MKPFDENDLIAYHLNELPLRRRTALERALKVDADLSAQSESIAETLRGFKGHSPFDLDSRLDDGLVEWNWKVLAPALPRYPVTKTTFLRRHLPVLAAAGLAFAAVTVTMVKLHHKPAGQGVSRHLPTGAPTLTMSSPAPRSASRTPDANTAPRTGGVRRQRTAGLRHTPGTFRSGQQESLLSTTPASASQPAQIVASAVPSPNLPTTPFGIAVVPPAPPAMSVPGLSSSASVESGSDPAQQINAAGRTTSKGQRIAVHHAHTTDATLAMGGTLIGADQTGTYGAPISQGATHAVIAMASFHQQLRAAAGYRVTLSYTRPDFQFGYGNVSSINGRVYEAAATYVIQGPTRGRLSTSAEAGGGVMKIVPTVKDVTTGSNVRIAGVFGVAADFAISKRIGLHAAYRGQVFNGPDFQYTGISAPITTGTLLSNEPSLGITYRFSRR